MNIAHNVYTSERYRSFQPILQFAPNGPTELRNHLAFARIFQRDRCFKPQLYTLIFLYTEK